MISKNEKEVVQAYYPEHRFGGFTHIDTTIEFYTRIAGILKDTDRVLDYGAGRGANIEQDDSPYRRRLQILSGRCARVDGCDIDPVVLQNPYLDEAKLINPSQPLPYDDGTFDLILCDWLFEHIQEPKHVADELLRVLRPGGYICARTPNKWGYISVAARLAGNRNHVRFLSRVQPGRQSVDVFPTVYRMNTAAALKRLFRGAAVTVYRPPNEPSYYFGRRDIFRAFRLLHALLPSWFRTTLLVFIEKEPLRPGGD
jgi:SAM-dependent methyltransferase